MHPLAISLLITQAVVPRSNGNDDLRSSLSPSSIVSLWKTCSMGGPSARVPRIFLQRQENLKYINSPQRYGPSERERGVLSRESDREIEKVREEEEEEEEE
jgi:hypothetical protein